MEKLVYRVQPVPDSVLQIVFDFGALQDETELMYVSNLIRQAVRIHRRRALIVECQKARQGTLSQPQTRINRT